MITKRLFFLMAILGASLTLQAQFELLTHEESLPCLNKKFSIVANVVLSGTGEPAASENTIKANIESLNTYFEPICVSFEVCEYRTIPNYQFDTLLAEAEYGYLQIENHQANRINMFFISEFEGDLEDACGFASLGGIGTLNGGGLVIRCNGVGTIVHEMGHYFGLLHTFAGSGEELVNGDNCETAGDGICDTPADPFVEGDDMEDYLDGCRFISLKTDANGEYYRPDVGNVMSYYPCSCGFTLGQYKRMAEVCQSSNGRMW